ncbi:MAG: GH36-type glycosyl hydrolase domain-containing protein [Gemmatimonadales bacterium]
MAKYRRTPHDGQSSSLPFWSTQPAKSISEAFAIKSATPHRFLSRFLQRSRDGREELLTGPIRGELLGAEHLGDRARAVAAGQRLARVGKKGRHPALLARLNETRRILDDAHDRLAAAAARNLDVGPAGEWFLDNFHIVQEHIHEVRESLPRGYYQELPELAGGGLSGYPRVYELAITLISHTEGRIDLENVDLFVEAFQRVSPLSIGELWAVPAMLRLGLIESVRRMALRTVQRLDEIELADEWAERILTASEQGASALGRALDAFVSDPPSLTAIFVSRFLQQIRLSRGAFPPLVWLERWIADEALNAEDASARSTQRLALTHIMMANSITSLRAIALRDWRTFVERQSAMEAVLREDPSGHYERMTFTTRDHYRHVVERTAKRTGLREDVAAARAVDLARRATSVDADDRRRGHVGFYLVDEGLAELERITGYRATPREIAHRWVLRHPNVVFVGGIALGTVVALALLFWLAGPAARPAWLAVLLFALIPANDIAVSVLNQLVTAFLPPRVLPKLDLRRHGVPPEYRTAVVIPTLFGSVEAVHEALENLEVQFLANREAHLHFAVLSDFTDATTETSETDASIVEAAAEGVRALNRRYAATTEDAFYLFHRPRRWNPQQGVWMGWERKRGKLAEFNRFVRGAGDGAFSVTVGNLEPLQHVRYVITLDADTVLPPDAAPLLVGTLAHPLNRPLHDPVDGRVVRGYGILQPRVGVSLPSANRSLFSAIHSGHPGVDPYTTAVSDVYQDLYGEGSFTGKGIYDVEAFERATAGRFPENTLLSHDLIEGSYARAGLVTDINVYDDYPARYLTFTRRKHRWIRGDWQLLGWLRSRVPGPDGPERNRLPLLSRWKILDNLRRSTVEMAQLSFLVAGWTVLPGSPLRWTLLGVLAIAAPWITSLLLALLRPPLDKSWRAYYATVGQDAVTSAEQVALAIIFLPHQAWVSADAILRTLWRLWVTRRSLLEWQTASQTERMSGASSAAWNTMWPAVALAAAILCLVLRVWWPPDSSDRFVELGVAVLPLAALWMISPALANALSAPALRRERRLPPARRDDALRYALLHWHYFDRHVTHETNGLVPDNVQEDPSPVVAMRTSPTNIGLQLLATVSACDLGFITIEDMTERLELAFRALERMRRFRGHFYNWYDLVDLHVLEPAYISTVDSGNLAGHLIALRQACLELQRQTPSSSGVWRALDTGLAIAAEQLNVFASAAPLESPVLARAVPAARAHLRDARATVAMASVLGSQPSFASAARHLGLAAEALADDASPATEWIEWCAALIADHERLDPRPPAETDLGSRLEAIAERAYDYAMEMDFRFLFEESRKLFAIGYQQATHSLDVSYYDLLASEARLASFVAVAKGDVPVDHWFRLGRTLTRAAGETALVSWSGSMFEYLMPALVMQSFPYTLLDQTYRGAVRRHIAHGAEHGVPWGVSESAYNVRDRHLTYQYRAFGVPDLALKRGLGRDLVIAPYASALAVLVDPHRALVNLGALEQRGALGPFGFRDALDYTRPNPGQYYAVVGTYMAHHVGMGLVALAGALQGQVWQRRFHADPIVRSAELLLHERLPRRLVLQEPQSVRADEALPDPEVERPAVRDLDTADTPQPRVALLGHLPYTIMVTNGGAGYSRYEELAVTRWRADGTRDHIGQFCYVKDITHGHAWSASHQPMCVPADRYRALLATDRVTFERADGDIETRTEIAVVPADAAEVRRVTVTNMGDETREIEVTSYGEIVLATPDADRAHPAFANLFVETEWHEWCTAVTATRRPRSATERAVWAVHVVATDKERVGPVSCETDRARFLGRGRSTRDPMTLESDGILSGTTGAVLDPIFALRARVRLRPGQSATVAFTTLVADTRERAFELADRYHDPHAAQRALDLAWTATQVELRGLGLTPADASIFQELAGHLFFSNPAIRAPQENLRRNRGSRQQLWANGVSGDWPIVLATIDSKAGLPTLRQLLAAHRYWRRRGMTVDVVVVNSQQTSYLQELHDEIVAAVYSFAGSGSLDQSGGIFVRRRDLLGPDDLLMLRATARVHIPCEGRSLGRVLEAIESPDAFDLLDEPPTPPEPPVTPFLERRAPSRRPERIADSRKPEPAPLAFDNGYGGITAEGDYLIRVEPARVPPAPWTNVIANPRGGFIVSERGAGFTWAQNSYLFRLTPWHNDPVSDPVTEAIYLRDDESDEIWSATPAPVRHAARFIVRHSAGTSSFHQEYAKIATELTLGLAGQEPVKVSILRLTNNDRRQRRLTLTAYAEWSLGVQREHTQHQVCTSSEAKHQAIFARNHFDPEYAGLVAFQAVSEPVAWYTADRREFLGRNGTTADPAALHRGRLEGATGGGLDPCAAQQIILELAPGESREVVVILGAVTGEDEARRVVAEYRDVRRAKAAVERSAAAWAERLSVIQVKTPDPAFDVMLNRWTLYQALACRMWARSGLYQSSGAYGFRDQLQDVMAFVYAEPGVAREHIVRAAGRQFPEGDVQHWWHPQSGRGVRTKFSDDLAWLPYVVDHYVRVTGDRSVLDERAPFISMRLLETHEHELYDLPRVTDEYATVYEHCLRALRKACTTGAHGLPLMGIGDWNDGMNRVGVEGKGESVWLAWFLVRTLRLFADHAEARGDVGAATEMRSQSDAYVAAVEKNAWDGTWYRRAYFDDGTPLGTASALECRIDSIAQSWSVISGAADPERQRLAMRSLEDNLVREDARLLMLLTPPFDITSLDPGYIKGYLPGVRENGAQYTHAALWAVLATAMRRYGDRAFQLYQMINPLSHAASPEQIETYKVEPYVVAADVYTAAGQLGRGGWTWYTGSASWMYRAGLESILGFRKHGDKLTIDPCVPVDWREYRIDYRHGRSAYAIVVANPDGGEGGVVEVTLDGIALEGDTIPLIDDGNAHSVRVLRSAPRPSRARAGS